MERGKQQRTQTKKRKIVSHLSHLLISQIHITVPPNTTQRGYHRSPGHNLLCLSEKPISFVVSANNGELMQIFYRRASCTGLPRRQNEKFLSLFIFVYLCLPLSTFVAVYCFLVRLFS